MNEVPDELWIIRDWFAGTYRLWTAGLCPCDGAELDKYIGSDGQPVEPEAIAEGVMLCGRCIAMEHHIRPPEVKEGILKAIAERR